MALTGTYQVEARTPIGMLAIQMTFEENGSVISGTISDANSRSEFTDGTFDGKTFAFSPLI